MSAVNDGEKSLAFIQFLGCCCLRAHTLCVLARLPSFRDPCSCAPSPSGWRMLQGVLEQDSGPGLTPQMLGPCSSAPMKYRDAGRYTRGCCTQDSLAGFTGVQTGGGGGGAGGRELGNVSQCCSGETEDITRIQGEEEMEGNPCAIQFRLESPVDASGTGGPLGRHGGYWEPTRVFTAGGTAGTPWQFSA